MKGDYPSDLKIKVMNFLYDGGGLYQTTKLNWVIKKGQKMRF